MAIKHVTENRIVAIDQFDQVVAVASRKSKGNLWYVFLTDYLSNSRSRNETPHVRISGKLNDSVQKKLVIAALTATTGFSAESLKQTPSDQGVRE